MGLPSHSRPVPSDRLHSLDALRAFALLLGIFFHGAAGYIENFPVQLWPMREPPSATLGAFFFVSHMFRMSLFYLLAGFFGRMLLERRGVGPFVRDRAKRILLPLVIGVPVVLITIGGFIVLGSLLGGMNLAALQAGGRTAAQSGRPACAVSVGAPLVSLLPPHLLWGRAWHRAPCCVRSIGAGDCERRSMRCYGSC